MATLRTWEERYGLVVPERSPGGHRLFSRDQIERLKFVKTRMTEGGTPADAHRLLAEWMERGSSSPRQPAMGERLLILLAERDPFSAEFQEYFLRTEGFDVTVAHDEQAARQSFQDTSPSLAVVDLLLSGGVGLDLCSSFKAGDEVPVVAVSVLETRDLAFAAGADAFLLKPLDPLQLVSTVKDLLGSSAFLTG